MKIKIILLLFTVSFAFSQEAQQSWKEKNQAFHYKAQVNTLKSVADLMLKRDKVLLELQNALNDHQDITNELKVESFLPARSYAGQYQTKLDYYNSSGYKGRVKGQSKNLVYLREELTRAQKKLNEKGVKNLNSLDVDQLSNKDKIKVQSLKNKLEKNIDIGLPKDKKYFTARTIIPVKVSDVLLKTSSDTEIIKQDKKLLGDSREVKALSRNVVLARENRMKIHDEKLKDLLLIDKSNVAKMRKELKSTLEAGVKGIDALVSTSKNDREEIDGKKISDYKKERLRYLQSIKNIENGLMSDAEVKKRVDKEIKARQSMLRYYQTMKSSPRELVLDESNLEGITKVASISAKSSLIERPKRTVKPPRAKVVKPVQKKLSNERPKQEVRVNNGAKTQYNNPGTSQFRTVNSQRTSRKPIQSTSTIQKKSTINTATKKGNNKEQDVKQGKVASRSTSSEISRQIADSKKRYENVEVDKDTNTICHNPEWVVDLPRRTVYGASCGSSGNSKVCVGHVRCYTKNGKFSFVRMSTCSPENCGEESALACTKEGGYGSLEVKDILKKEQYENNIIRYNVNRK